MKCPNCGTENNNLAMFCRKCGAKLAAGGGGSGSFQPGGGGGNATMLDPNMQQGGGGGGPAKGKTVVDPNVPGGGGMPPVQNKQRGAKGATVIDTGTPDNQGGQKATASARRLVAFIVSYSLDPMGTYFPLYEGRVKMGSDADADLVIDRAKDSQISGTHVVLLYRRGVLSLRDQDSSNGTFVDVGTVTQEKYPELYEGRGAANLKDGEFGDTSVHMMEVDDERIVLDDNSYFMLGSTVFKVKLVD